MRMIMLTVLIISLGSQTQTLNAQPAGLSVEDRVRVSVSSKVEFNYAGTVLPSTSDSLNIATEHGSVSIPVEAVHHIKVFSGRQANPVRGALTGAAIGGLVLGGLAAASEVGCDGWFCTGVPVAFAIGGGAGVLLGGIVGSAIGLSVQTDVWREIPVGADAAIQSSIGVNASGLTLALELRSRPR